MNTLKIRRCTVFAHPIRDRSFASQEFLEPNGILDGRHMAVHERLLDVTGHLKRYLAELMRRSQFVAGLRELSSTLLRVSESAALTSQVEDVVLDFWQTDQLPCCPCPALTGCCICWGEPAVRRRSRTQSGSSPSFWMRVSSSCEMLHSFELPRPH